MEKITDRWREPATETPSPTQFSLRPTVIIAAQIHALTKMFPGRTKTEIINDLLKAGLSKAIDEITGEKELFKRLGEEPTLDDFSPEGRQFCEIFQEEKKALLDKVAKGNVKRVGKK